MVVDFHALLSQIAEEEKGTSPNGATSSPAARTAPTNVHHLDQERTDRYAASALQREATQVAQATKGTRNDTLNTAAFNLGQFVGAHALDRDTVWDALHGAARSAGLPEKEIEATLASGLKAGEAEPRQIPEAHTTTDPPPVTTLDDAEDNEVTLLDRLNILDLAELKRAEDTGEDWILEPLIGAGRMTALYSAPKAGKSLLILEIAAALALGLPVLGQPAGPRRRVLYVDFENDPLGDIRPRLEDMGHDLDDLVEWLHVAHMPSIAKLDTPQGGHELAIAATDLNVDLVIIDTVSRTITGEENDNNTWLAFYRNTGIPLKREGIACLRLDHAGKDAEKGMRGGSAKYGDVDLVWRLTALSETVIQLDCTDHRMRLDTASFALVRHTDPLRHDVDGDPFAIVTDTKERELDKLLDRLGLPNDGGRRVARRLLREAGHKVNNSRLERVLKSRKLRLDTSPDSRPDSSTEGCAPGTPRARARSAPSTPVPATTPKGCGPGGTPGVPGGTPTCPTCDEPIDDHLPGCPRRDRS